MPGVLADFEAAYSDPVAGARAWRSAGGRCVGYFCDNTPVELIAAAGFLPVRVTGDPDYDRAVEAEYILPYIPKLFASVRQAGLEFVGAMCVRLLSGVYDDLDFLVIPASRKPILNLYPQLLAAKAAFPDLRLPETHILDHAHAPFESARQFNRRSLLALKAKLEAWAGRPIGEAALDAAIRAGNEGRRLIRALNARRNSDPPTLSGAAFLAIVGSGMTMDRAAHNDRLRAFLAEPPGPPRPGLRVFLGGSPTDNPRLYEAIESHGATVVGEDHCWGERCADLPIDGAAGGTEGVIGRWLTAPPCGLRFPIEASPANCVARAKVARADCAILSVYSGDELQVWDTPQEVDALRAAGFPTLHLKDQPYRLDRAAVGAEIGRFLRGVSVGATERV